MYYRKYSVNKWTVGHQIGGKFLLSIPNSTRATSDKVYLNTPADDTSYILGTMEFHGNEFNTVFSKKVQWEEYPGMFVIAA